MSVTTWSSTPSGQDSALSISTEPDVRPETSNRVYSGAISMNGTGPAIQHGVIRANERDLTPNTATMMSTAQNNGGMATTNITPESTVDIPGVGRTSVKVAERLGYLERKGDGTYEETFQEDFMAAPGDVPAEPVPDVFSPQTEQAYNEMIAPVPQDTYDSLLGSAAAQLGSQDCTSMEAMTASLAPRLATSMGIEPERAAAMIEAGASVWQKQADAVVSKMGADPEEFYTWARANRRNDLQQAIIQQLYARNTKGYTALVEDFYHNTEPSFADLKSQGYEVRKGADGKTLIKNKGGMWVSAAALRKMRGKK